MKFFVVCVSFSILLQITHGQLPPRLNIPGALLVGQAKPAPFRTQRIHADGGVPPRLRRPIPNAAPAPIRPVVEESEEPPAPTPSNNFDDEVSKLGISVLQSAVRQAVTPEEEPPRQLHFRPERPVPVLRENIRENVPPSPRPPPPLRQPEQRENIPRGFPRQEQREELPLPVRQPQPVRHSQARQQIAAQPPPQVVRQPVRGPARQPSQHLDDEGVRPHSSRNRKPPVQILRKYRTDNPDGSITWGFENEDGTFKEETLGVDCITRGKYGYIDPDGVRREYKYETGNKCDEPEEDEDLPPPNRPQAIPPQPRKQFQFRPLPPQ